MLCLLLMKVGRVKVDGGRRIKSEKQYVCYKGKWIESDKLSIPHG